MGRIDVDAPTASTASTLLPSGWTRWWVPAVRPLAIRWTLHKQRVGR